MSIDKYAAPLERTLATALVDRALAEGLLVSVFDGGELVVSRSNDRTEVLEALASTDEDRLTLRNPDGSIFGRVWLIWGNGADLFSDWSDSGELDDMVWSIIEAHAP
ncbi:hypothetical protein [Xanthomonas tesorieronis]|uniref:hypothetical protein n=1 Tax=Xanthomonas tesorieronis TaxID=3160839 RepID=UPI003514B267